VHIGAEEEFSGSGCGVECSVESAEEVWKAIKVFDSVRESGGTPVAVPTDYKDLVNFFKTGGLPSEFQLWKRVRREKDLVKRLSYLPPQTVVGAVSAVDSALWSLRGKVVGGSDASEKSNSTSGDTGLIACCPLELPFYDQEVVLYFCSDNNQVTKRGESIVLTEFDNQREWLEKEVTNRLLDAVKTWGFKALRLSFRPPFGNFYLPGDRRGDAYLKLSKELLRFCRKVVGPASEITLILDCLGNEAGCNSTRDYSGEEGAFHWPLEIAEVLAEEGYVCMDQPLLTADGVENFRKLKRRIGNSELGKKLKIGVSWGDYGRYSEEKEDSNNSNSSSSLWGFEDFLVSSGSSSDNVDFLQPESTVIGGVSAVKELLQKRRKHHTELPIILPRSYSDGLALKTDITEGLLLDNNNGGGTLGALVDVPLHVLDNNKGEDDDNSSDDEYANLFSIGPEGKLLMKMRT